MAHVERRRLPSGKVSYRVRYIDPEGRERSRSFTRRADADDFYVSVSHRLREGSYIDPSAGRTTVEQYLTGWLAQQTHLRPNTVASYRAQFRTMVFPHLGKLPIGKIKPSTIRTWQRTLLDRGYAPRTIGIARGVVAGAFNTAVLDRLLPASPFTGVKAPAVEREQVVPLTVAQVLAGEAALRARKNTQRYGAVIPTGAGTGVRSGELWGLTVDRIDFLRKTVRVDRQLTGRAGPLPVFGPPKTKASIRTIPLPETVIAALAAHLATYPAILGDGLWVGSDGKRRPIEHAGLVFTTSRSTPMTRPVWGKAWRAAATAMGLPPGKGLHQLRHFYASLLIADRRNIKEVQERLGHATAQETLDTYAHLFPDSDDGTRAAIDRAFQTDEDDAAPKDDAASDE